MEVDIVMSSETPLWKAHDISQALQVSLAYQLDLLPCCILIPKIYRTSLKNFLESIEVRTHVYTCFEKLDPDFLSQRRLTQLAFVHVDHETSHKPVSNPHVPKFERS